ncbi:hypothetical protein [Phenylobacterium sp.]|uniref:hypothetical protein n=1 Tax=Phenylobacterium sp. TaxID=1871053 RepID=UPI0025EDB66A|nr:hypothetical protein [Phenylobacterium sp.]
MADGPQAWELDSCADVGGKLRLQALSRGKLGRRAVGAAMKHISRATTAGRARRPRPRPGKPTTDGLLEHLRRVHFALIATSFALLVAASIRPDGSLERAYAQAQAIAGIETKIFGGPPLVALSEKHDMPFLSDDRSYLPLARSQAFLSQIPDRLNESLGLPKDRIVVSGTSFAATMMSVGNFTLRGNADRTYAAGTLGDFQQRWEFFRTAVGVTLDGFVSPGPVRFFKFGEELTTAERDRARAALARARGEIVINDAKLGLRQNKSATQNFAPRQWYIVAELAWRNEQEAPGFNEVWFPIPARRNHEIDVQTELFPASAGVDLTGRYEDVFGDLNFYSKGLESLKLDQLIAYIRELYKRDNKNVQVLGVEIPQDSISRWGLLVLLAVQTYMLLHIQHGRKDWADRLPTYPWVALYPGLLPRLVTTVTIAILPIATSAMLAWQGWEGSTNPAIRASVTVAVVISVILGVATAWQAPAGPRARRTARRH